MLIGLLKLLTFSADMKSEIQLAASLRNLGKSHRLQSLTGYRVAAAVSDPPGSDEERMEYMKELRRRGGGRE